jgi:hypothetical protein
MSLAKWITVSADKVSFVFEVQTFAIAQPQPPCLEQINLNDWSIASY